MEDTFFLQERELHVLRTVWSPVIAPKFEIIFIYLKLKSLWVIDMLKVESNFMNMAVLKNTVLVMIYGDI